MITLLLVALVLVPFGFVLLFGAPYLPTRRVYARQALDLLDLQPGQILVDLGSGDGVILLEAARRGLVCYGYELNPLLWLISRLRTWRYRQRVQLYCRNFWKVPLPTGTAGVFVFLLERYMSRLEVKLQRELAAGTAVVSYAFEIPSRRPRRKQHGLFLYTF